MAGTYTQVQWPSMLRIMMKRRNPVQKPSFLASSSKTAFETLVGFPCCAPFGSDHRILKICRRVCQLGFCVSWAWITYATRPETLRGVQLELCKLSMTNDHTTWMTRWVLLSTSRNSFPFLDFMNSFPLLDFMSSLAFLDLSIRSVSPRALLAMPRGDICTDGPAERQSFGRPPILKCITNQSLSHRSTRNTLPRLPDPELGPGRPENAA